VAALIAVALGDAIGLVAGLMLAVIASGVMLSTLESGRSDVMAGDFDSSPTPSTVRDRGLSVRIAPVEHPPTRGPRCSRGGGASQGRSRRRGRSAALVPSPASRCQPARRHRVVIPLLLQRRLSLTRAALPLVVIAGVGEILGSMLSAWGSRDSIAITAVMGSQFAAFAAVAAYFMFKERLGRLQVAGVALIVAGVTVLAATAA
jgi:multidrug transporter EmrE-like cation transporter